MAKRPKKPERVVINGIPHKLALFEVTGRFPNGKFRHLKRITEEGTVRVDTPEAKWFITAYVPQSALNLAPAVVHNPPPDGGAP